MSTKPSGERTGRYTDKFLLSVGLICMAGGGIGLAAIYYLLLPGLPDRGFGDLTVRICEPMFKLVIAIGAIVTVWSIYMQLWLRKEEGLSVWPHIRSDGKKDPVMSKKRYDTSYDALCAAWDFIMATDTGMHVCGFRGDAVGDGGCVYVEKDMMIVRKFRYKFFLDFPMDNYCNARVSYFGGDPVVVRDRRGAVRLAKNIYLSERTGSADLLFESYHKESTPEAEWAELCGKVGLDGDGCDARIIHSNGIVTYCLACEWTFRDREKEDAADRERQAILRTISDADDRLAEQTCEEQDAVGEYKR